MMESTGILPFDLDFGPEEILCLGSDGLDPDPASLATPLDGALMMSPQLGQGPLTPAMDSGTESCLPQTGQENIINEVGSCGTGRIPVIGLS